MTNAAVRKEIADALERVVAIGNHRNRTSREWAENEAEYCEALARLRPLFSYGDWIPFVEERGWSYDDVSRCLRFHKLGGTAELLMEHRMTGALALLSEQHRAAKMEAEPIPEPGPAPASEEDDKFCSSAKFERPAPESEEAEAAPELELDLPDVPPPPPARRPLLDRYNHADPAHRMLFCLTLHGLSLRARVALMIHAWRHGEGGWGGSIVSNGQIAAVLGVKHFKDKKTGKRDHRSERNTVGRLLKEAEDAGYLRNVERENAPSFRITFPAGPPTRQQLEMVLLRSFDTSHDASDAEAAESAAARPAGGGEETTPGVVERPAGDGGETTPGAAGKPALTEKETEKETGRRGTRAQGGVSPEPDSPHPPDSIKAFGIWNEVAAGTGMRPAVEIDAERAAKLQARVREAGGLEEFRAVCERAGRSKALTGRKPGSWPADLDQFLEPRFFRRVREGGWDDAPGELERVHQALRDADPDPEERRAEVLMSPLAGDAPDFAEALCDRIDVGWVWSWLKDCRLEWRGDNDAALLFPSGFYKDRARAKYHDAIRGLWRELHGGELVLETRRAA